MQSIRINSPYWHMPEIFPKVIHRIFVYFLGQRHYSMDSSIVKAYHFVSIISPRRINCFASKCQILKWCVDWFERFVEIFYPWKSYYTWYNIYLISWCCELVLLLDEKFNLQRAPSTHYLEILHKLTSSVLCLPVETSFTWLECIDNSMCIPILYIIFICKVFVVIKSSWYL